MAEIHGHDTVGDVPVQAKQTVLKQIKHTEKLPQSPGAPVGVGPFPQQVELGGGDVRHAEHHVVHLGFLVIPPVEVTPRRITHKERQLSAGEHLDVCVSTYKHGSSKSRDVFSELER